MAVFDRQAIVVFAAKGRYTGKPRPWLVIQSNAFLKTDSVTVCMITQSVIPNAPLLRVDVLPSPVNGLRKPSQIQIDKVVTVKRDDIDRLLGRLESQYMAQCDEALRYFLNI